MNKYGTCPTCGAFVISRERRLNGYDTCENEHKFPSKDTIPILYNCIKKEKLLFLDIDGVLNCHSQLMKINDLHDDKVNLLKTIQHTTSCDIILSSAWRHSTRSKDTLAKKFVEYNIPIWTHETPALRGERRHEIYSFLSANPRYKRYRVAGVDDWEEAELSHSQVRDALEFSNYQFFKTDPKVGLTQQQASDIINFLNR